MLNDSLKHPVFEVSVKALIYQDGKLLLAKDDSGKWDLPGGRLDEGEDIEACLHREVLEELGVKVVDIESRPKFAKLIQFADDKKRLLIGFTVQLYNQEFKPS